MSIEKKAWGNASCGTPVNLYTLDNGKMSIVVSDFGATLVNLFVSDKSGGRRDVVWGYDNVSDYETLTYYFGATVGRSANRIGGAKFSLDGTLYPLADNDNGNNLHSGPNGYHLRVWDAEVRDGDQPSITLSLSSADMDQGYPGAAQVSVTYTLTAEGGVRIDYLAKADKKTVFNMTNHSYFNLSGQQSDTILDQIVSIDADKFTPVNSTLIPTGELRDVAGTPMDFRAPKPVGRDIAADYEQLAMGNGYDHNWILNNGGKFAKVATMYSEESGIEMDVYTDLPGMQMYAGNFLEGKGGKGDRNYGHRSALCFETQYFPDTVNKPDFPSCVFEAGEEYKTSTEYRFSVK